MIDENYCVFGGELVSDVRSGQTKDGLHWAQFSLRVKNHSYYAYAYCSAFREDATKLSSLKKGDKLKIKAEIAWRRGYKGNEKGNCHFYVTEIVAIEKSNIDPKKIPKTNSLSNIPEFKADDRPWK